MLRVTQVKSAIGSNSSQRETLRSLGFKKRKRTVVHSNSPIIQGMLAKVSHLVVVETLAPPTREGN